jgi:hypothetical protein
MARIREHARYAVIDGCPVPRRHAHAFRAIRRESGVPFNSIYRGDDAAGILHEHGHHTQAEVIQLYEQGIPGYGPADPVRESSHCLYNDGVVAPHRARGSKLPGWQVGFDVNDADVPRVEAALRKLGYKFERVYHTGSEYHHFNLRRPPARKRRHVRKHH